MRQFFERRDNGRQMHGSEPDIEHRRPTFDDEQLRYPQREGRRRDTVEHAGFVKVIEVLAESDRSWEDAAEAAVFEASKSVRNIKSVYVKDMQAIVRHGRIVCWRLNAKISFAIDHDSERHHER